LHTILSPVPLTATASAPVWEAGDVPTAKIPAEETPTAPSMPTSVRVAIIAMAILAGLLLLNAGLTWYGREGVADAIVDAGADVSRDEAERYVVLWLVPYLVLGLLFALASWFLPRRQPWARWMGLAASVVLALLTLFSAMTAGGVTVASLLLLVLSIAATTSLLARTTTAYVPSLRTRA
jgi:hypothetical protein